MEVEGTRRRWTYAEFARLPSEGSTRHEVIAGELVVTPGPSTRHQRVVARLIHRLVGFTEANHLGEVFPGPVDVLFAEGDYVEPDIAFVGNDRSDRVTERGIEGAPDLIVEVVSPATAARDRGFKLDRYRHFGVPEYWVVDPDAETIEVWDLEGNAARPTSFGGDAVLRWTPSGGATLEVVLSDLFATR